MQGRNTSQESLAQRIPDAKDPLLRRRKLSWRWRLFVVFTVALAGVAGGAIGAAVARLGCEECSAPSVALGAALGMAFAGIGMAILAMLVARSFVEWEDSRQCSSP
ncbi:MAG: hypothetical protein C4317_01440 [Acidimicrobiia bacterium]